ncbi:hypothetical protein HanLR1_Chr16g0630221 [Helianthus annuus]|nr:hypothetical protein HanLR1_Chr16g0630221 [Helianthus annuus]
MLLMTLLLILKIILFLMLPLTTFLEIHPLALFSSTSITYHHVMVKTSVCLYIFLHRFLLDDGLCLCIYLCETCVLLCFLMVINLVFSFSRVVESWPNIFQSFSVFPVVILLDAQMYSYTDPSLEEGVSGVIWMMKTRHYLHVWAHLLMKVLN